MGKLVKNDTTEMEPRDLERLHRCLLLIADEIDRICRTNNIPYTLTGGSMLGAVRHHGFIPWDDDMDIAMLREHYDIFLKACKSELGEQFELQTAETDANYFYGFAKILLKNTCVVQESHSRTQHKKGIYIDVFPLDNIPNDSSARKKHALKNYILIKMLSRKGGSDIDEKHNFIKWLGFHVIDIVNLFVTQGFLTKQLESNMRKYEAANSSYICNMGGFYGYERETAKRDYFIKTEDMVFEDRKYSVISMYDSYLTGVYGDYMKLPPVNKRHTHKYQVLEFGPYENISEF